MFQLHGRNPPTLFLQLGLDLRFLARQNGSYLDAQIKVRVVWNYCFECRSILLYEIIFDRALDNMIFFVLHNSLFYDVKKGLK
jgi:hypothetical protein